jgi:hypothetical protein
MRFMPVSCWGRAPRGLPLPGGGPLPSRRGGGAGRVGDVLAVVGRAARRRLVGELDRGHGDLHEVELVGERLDHHAERIELVLEQALVQRARVSSRRPVRRSAIVGTRSTAIGWPGDALDRLEHPVLARLASVIATPSRPARPDAADAVHVGLGGRRHVVVDDVGELVDVQAARGDVGGDEQVGRAALRRPMTRSRCCWSCRRAAPRRAGRGR